MVKRYYVIQASCFDKRGRLISSAFNDYKSSCALMRYYAGKSGYPHRVFNHAEILAIDRAIKSRKEIAKMTIIRYNCNGELRNSKPCEVCSYAIADLGIKEVYYSTEKGMVKL